MFDKLPIEEAAVDVLEREVKHWEQGVKCCDEKSADEQSSGQKRACIDRELRAPHSLTFLEDHLYEHVGKDCIRKSGER